MAPQRGHLARFPAWLSPHWILCPLGQRNSITSKSFARAETKRKGSLAEKAAALPPDVYLNPRQRRAQQAQEGISPREIAKPRSSQKQRQPTFGPWRHCRFQETAGRACRERFYCADRPDSQRAGSLRISGLRPTPDTSAAAARPGFAKSIHFVLEATIPARKKARLRWRLH